MNIRGYAAPWNCPTIVDAGTHEEIAPGALSIIGDVRLLWGDHDDGRTIARTGDGSLKLWPGEIGLCFEACLDTSDQGSRSVYSSIAAGGLGCSIAMDFRLVDERMVAGARHRIVRRADLDGDHDGVPCEKICR